MNSQSLAAKLYLANAVVLITHEIDSAYWREWELFRSPSGIQLFLILHILLIALVALRLPLSRSMDTFGEALFLRSRFTRHRGVSCSRWLPACRNSAVPPTGFSLVAGSDTGHFVVAIRRSRALSCARRMKAIVFNRCHWSRVGHLMPASESTEFVRDRIAANQLCAVIDHKYLLGDIAKAYRYVETRQKVGIVVGRGCVRPCPG